MHYEALAQRAGHKTYSAGSVEEAIRYVGIYVPDVILVTGPILGGEGALSDRLRASERSAVATIPLITTDSGRFGMRGIHLRRGNIFAAIDGLAA